MSGILVAPTEPKAVKELGTSSSIPERYGADVLFGSPHHGLVAIQRKEIRDLCSSMLDGRLAKEVAQMENRAIGVKVLVVEGRLVWSVDGELMVDEWAKVTKEQLRKFLWTIRARGVWVEYTESIGDTVETVRWLRTWAAKERHRSLDARPGPSRGAWGRVSSRAWRVHLLTSFDGIGPETAEAILEHFGQVPLAWTVGEDDLLAVKGIGKVRAKRLVKALEEMEEVAA